MKKKYYLILLVIIAQLCVECTPKRQAELSIGDPNEKVELNSLFRQAKITRLIEDKNNRIGNINLLKYCDSLFYCLSSTNDRIVAFYENGQAISTLHKQGHGRGEYLNIYDFDVENGEVYLLCFPACIMVTDARLNVKRTIPLEGDFSKICVKGSTLYLYSAQQRALFVLENEAELTQVHSEPILPSCPKPYIPIFYEVNDKLFFTYHGSPMLYEINGYKVTPYLEINYENKEKALDRYKQEQILAKEERVSYASPELRAIMDAGDNYLFIYVYKMAFRGCLVNKVSKTLVRDGIVIGSPSPKIQCESRVFATGTEMRLMPLPIRNTLQSIDESSCSIPTSDDDFAEVIVEYGN